MKAKMKMKMQTKPESLGSLGSLESLDRLLVKKRRKK